MHLEDERVLKISQDLRPASFDLLSSPEFIRYCMTCTNYLYRYQTLYSEYSYGNETIYIVDSSERQAYRRMEFVSIEVRIFCWCFGLIFSKLLGNLDIMIKLVNRNLKN